MYNVRLINFLLAIAKERKAKQMVCQMDSCEKREFNIGDILSSKTRRVSCNVAKIEKDNVNLDCVKYSNLADLTMFIFETFRKLKKSQGINSCNFVLYHYGVVKVDSDTSEQRVYNYLVERQIY